jgi:ATP-binding cassette, subfamily F, member 3
VIVFNKLTLARGAKRVLNGASVTLHPGEKVALVGRNGAGKSSLFALLIGTLQEESGDFSMPASWRMAQVSQQMPDSDDSATDFVLAGDTPLLEAQAALALAEAQEDGEAMAHAHVALHDAGAHDARARAQTLLMGLGFTVPELDHAVNTFSGGWRMRLQLARALMCPADLLLLDEPTNHLDLDALVWLESWLKRFAGTLIVISHDREFLDAITRVTLHLEDGLLTRYGGNYSTFEELRSQQIELQNAAFEKQQDRVAHLQKFIDRFKAKASKAKQAQSRVKALERMERIAPVITAADFSFEFKAPAALPNPMLTFDRTSVGYSGKDGAAPTTILTGVERTVLAGQRIGILGANGQGKSTLIKTIAGQIAALDAPPTLGKGLSIGYFAQEELDVLRVDESPLQHMVRLAADIGRQAKEQELRGFLGGFRFIDAMVNQPVGTMSGGEKARLVLAMLVWQRPNLLLLDEPTNHLDLTTREALAMALNGFDGSVMLVSHDRALLRSVCDEFWLVGAGVVKPFEGDLEDYQAYLLEESKRKREAAQGKKPSAATNEGDGQRSSGAQRREQAAKRQALSEQLKPLKKRLQQTEARMGTIEFEREKLNARLLDSPPATEIAEIGRKLKALEDEMAVREAAWLEASEAIEALSGETT